MSRLIASRFMGCVLAAGMPGFVGSMERGAASGWRAGGAVVAAAVLLYANRSQARIGDTEHMTATIPITPFPWTMRRAAPPRLPGCASWRTRSSRRRYGGSAEIELLIGDIGRSGPRGDAVLALRPAVLTPEMLPEIREAVQ